MPGQQSSQRNFNLFLRGGDFGEHRRLVQRHTHIQPDNHQHSGEDKRYAPAPCHKLLVGQQPGEQQEGAVGEEEADRRTELRERAVQRAFARRGVFSRQQRRTAPFAAQSQTLAEARQRQQHRCKNTNALVAGQQADNHRGDPHGQQRSDQRDLTANAIAEVAK